MLMCIRAGFRCIDACKAWACIARRGAMAFHLAVFAEFRLDFVGQRIKNGLGGEPLRALREDTVNNFIVKLKSYTPSMDEVNEINRIVAKSAALTEENKNTIIDAVSACEVVVNDKASAKSDGYSGQTIWTFYNYLTLSDWQVIMSPMEPAGNKVFVVAARACALDMHWLIERCAAHIAATALAAQPGLSDSFLQGAAGDTGLELVRKVKDTMEWHAFGLKTDRKKMLRTYPATPEELNAVRPDLYAKAYASEPPAKSVVCSQTVARLTAVLPCRASKHTISVRTQPRRRGRGPSARALPYAKTHQAMTQADGDGHGLALLGPPPPRSGLLALVADPSEPESQDLVELQSQQRSQLRPPSALCAPGPQAVSAASPLARASTDALASPVAESASASLSVGPAFAFATPSPAHASPTTTFQGSASPVQPLAPGEAPGAGQLGVASAPREAVSTEPEAKDSQVERPEAQPPAAADAAPAEVAGPTKALNALAEMRQLISKGKKTKRQGDESDASEASSQAPEARIVKTTTRK